MPDVMDCSLFPFYAQALSREKKIVTEWYHRNIDVLKRSLEGKSDVKLTETDLMLDKFIAEIERKADKPPPKDYVAPQLDVCDTFDTMKPVEPEITRLIYTSSVKDGRQKYLHARNHTAPEDKYYFQECSSFVYGWHLKKSIQPLFKKYPRCEVIKQSFYRKSGIGADPTHYKKPAK